MKELFYHELTHAAHYAALGNSWYSAFVNAELFEINYTGLIIPENWADVKNGNCIQITLSFQTDLRQYRKMI